MGISTTILVVAAMTTMTFSHIEAACMGTREVCVHETDTPITQGPIGLCDEKDLTACDRSRPRDCSGFPVECACPTGSTCCVNKCVGECHSNADRSNVTYTCNFDRSRTVHIC